MQGGPLVSVGRRQPNRQLQGPSVRQSQSQAPAQTNMHGKTQQREEKAQARTPVSTGKSASAGHSVMQRSPVDFDPLSAVESETGRNRASSASNAPPLPARPKKLTSSGTILQEAAVGKWKVVEKMCEQRRVSRGITVAIHSLALLKQKNYVKARQKAKELGGGFALLLNLAINLEENQSKSSRGCQFDELMVFFKKCGSSDGRSKWTVLRLLVDYLDCTKQQPALFMAHDCMLEACDKGAFPSSEAMDAGCDKSAGFLRLLTLLHASRVMTNAGDVCSASALTNEARLCIGSGNVSAIRRAFCDMNKGVELAMSGKYARAVDIFEQVTSYVRAHVQVSHPVVEEMEVECSCPSDLDVSSSASLLLLTATNNIAVCALQCGDVLRGIAVCEELLSVSSSFALDVQFCKTLDVLYALAFEPSTAQERQRQYKQL